MSSDKDEILINLGVVRDQETRPTCMSFALSDVHRSRIKLPEPLSPKSLHRAACARGKTSVDEAISVFMSLATLEMDGQTTEESWPYHAESCVNPSAIFHKRKGFREAFDGEAVAALLGRGTPVVIVIDIGEEFFTRVGDEPLEAGDALPKETCHAVIIAGSRLGRAGRYFRLRNSWGVGWGSHGHAWASTAYLLARSPTIVRID